MSVTANLRSNTHSCIRRPKHTNRARNEGFDLGSVQRPKTPNLSRARARTHTKEHTHRKEHTHTHTQWQCHLVLRGGEGDEARRVRQRQRQRLACSRVRKIESDRTEEEPLTHQGAAVPGIPHDGTAKAISAMYADLVLATVARKKVQHRHVRLAQRRRPVPGAHMQQRLRLALMQQRLHPRLQRTGQPHSKHEQHAYLLKPVDMHRSPCDRHTWPQPSSPKRRACDQRRGLCSLVLAEHSPRPAPRRFS